MNGPSSYSVAAALAFVAEHGVVLASAKGLAPRLIDVIAGEQIVGNWWSHRRASEIYNILVAVQESDGVLVCRLLAGKITLIHRRLWPALACLAEDFEPGQLAKVTEEHTSTGRHVAGSIPFPQWVPSSVLAEAKSMSKTEAQALLGSWLDSTGQAKGGSPRRAKRDA